MFGERVGPGKTDDAEALRASSIEGLGAGSPRRPRRDDVVHDQHTNLGPGQVRRARAQRIRARGNLLSLPTAEPRQRRTAPAPLEKR